MNFAKLMRFYSKKRILITGHNGFKGSWLSLLLKELSADVMGFSMNPPSKPCLYEALKLKSEVPGIRGDITKYKEIEKAIRDYDPEIIIHLAARPILLNSYEAPLETYQTNTIGTLNLLQAAYKVGSPKAILNVTTDKVYENTGKRKAYTEEDKLGGHDPYSSSKACSELVTQSYRESFFSEIGVGVATARAGNVIGGGDWGEKRLVPDLITSFVAKRKLVIRHPEAVRPWQYVLDVLSGYLMLTESVYLEPSYYSGAYNFSNRYPKTVIELVRAFIQAWGSGSVEVRHSTKHEDQFLALDSSKAMKKLGWKPATTFNEMASLTTEWYKRYYSNKEIIEYSKKIVEDYAERQKVIKRLTQ